MKIEIKNIIATFQRVIRACNGTTAQNVPQQMLYIVGICGSMAYEEGKLGKVYTIRDTDTTYRWIYYEKD